MKVDKLIDNLKNYMTAQINDIVKGNPMLSFFKPVITRAIQNGIDKSYNTISLLADKEGNIDIDNLLAEMTDNLINTSPFTINTAFLGDIIIGNGSIKLILPYVNKDIVFNSNDLHKLRELLNINTN